MTTIYHCEECGWEGPQEEIGITHSDEGAHCWQCPECCGCEIELKGGEQWTTSLRDLIHTGGL